MARPRTQVVFTSWDERNALELWVARPPGNRTWLSIRAHTVLLNADGYGPDQIVDQLGISLGTATKWPRRYLEGGIASLRDAARSGVPRSITDEQIEGVLTATIEERPADGGVWSTRSMAAHVGLSPASVRRIWRDHGLRPDRLEIFGFASDATFVERFRAAAFYLKPPQAVFVLVVAADNTGQWSPGPPQTGARTDADRGALLADLREGVTLALGQEIADENLAKEFGRKRDFDLRRLFVRIDQATPENRDVHMVLDHSTTRVTKPLYDWVLEHLRFSVHNAPTTRWWLRLVEEWMAILVDRGAAQMVEESVVAMDDWMEAFENDPTPFFCYNGLPLDLSKRPQMIKN